MSKPVAWPGWAPDGVDHQVEHALQLLAPAGYRGGREDPDDHGDHVLGPDVVAQRPVRDAGVEDLP